MNEKSISVSKIIDYNKLILIHLQIDINYIDLIPDELNSVQ